MRHYFNDQISNQTNNVNCKKAVVLWKKSVNTSNPQKGSLSIIRSIFYAYNALQNTVQNYITRYRREYDPLYESCGLHIQHKKHTALIKHTRDHSLFTQRNSPQQERPVLRVCYRLLGFHSICEQCSA